MPQVVLQAEEVGPDILPMVCIVCGRPATVRVPVGFSWLPAWNYLLLVAGIWPWLIAYLVLRRATTVDTPACDRHRRHWLTRKLLLPAGVFGSLAVLFGGAVVGPEPRGGPPVWVLATSFGLLVLTAVAVTVHRLNGVRAVAITRESITLAGADPGFVSALEAGRAEFARRERDWLERHDRKGGTDR